MLNRESITETITALLVFLFLYTGISKYVDHTAFEFALKKSPLIKSLAGTISITLPGIEILVAAFLVFPKTRLSGLWLSLGLLSTFTFYLVYMVLYTDKLPCSCGGVISKLSWKNHIPFNIAFIILITIAIIMTNKLRHQSEQNDKYSLQ